MKFPKQGAMRLIAGSLTILLLTGLAAEPVHAEDGSPVSPILVDRNASGRAGDWWRGATPPNADPTKPVLVFVAGLHSNAQDWYGQTRYSGPNDMYAYAYANGYRTAFVDLSDADGEARSMWTNGQILADTLADITARFGVEQVNVVAHSKGGIDTNAAVAFYGADSRVSRVFTISTPHLGSPLANLAYSHWGGWLAELLGMRDEGVYVLQTSYMEWFRSVADEQSADHHVDYYTASGTNWGRLGSALWFGGLYLSSTSRNDGAVPVVKATKPGASHVATLPYNHDNIRVGHNTWPLVSGYVSTLARVGVTQPTPASLDPATDNASLILRGGSLAGRTVTQFPVESGAFSLDVALLANDTMPAALIDPGGRRWPLTPGEKGDTLGFPGAVSLAAQVLLPRPGFWQLEMMGPQQGAYLLAVRPDSDLTMRVGLSDGTVGATGQTLAVPVSVTGRGAQVNPRVSLQVGQVAPGRPTQWLPLMQTLGTQPGTVDATLSLPAAPVLLNVSGTITGTLPDGTTFERNFIRSVAARAPGANSAATLRSLTHP